MLKRHLAIASFVVLSAVGARADDCRDWDDFVAYSHKENHIAGPMWVEKGEVKVITYDEVSGVWERWSGHDQIGKATPLMCFETSGEGFMTPWYQPEDDK